MWACSRVDVLTGQHLRYPNSQQEQQQLREQDLSDGGHWKGRRVAKIGKIAPSLLHRIAKDGWLRVQARDHADEERHRDPE